MKKLICILFVIAVFLTSCGGGQLNQQLVYEKNPHYAWGYAEFFGDYYQPENGNKNNVVSISLFSDSLKLNELRNLTGLGQYLYLEDVFQASTDTFLQVGTYNVSDSGLKFTIAPGKNDTVDKQVYPIGAYISYFEYNAANSTMKLITGGSMSVSLSGSVYHIACNFNTSDGLELKGNYSAELPHIDQSLATPKSGIRKKLLYTRK